jgi:hypothetical protein
MKYRVRDGFYVQLGDRVYLPGEAITLTSVEALDRAHQIEALPKPNPKDKLSESA